MSNNNFIFVVGVVFSLVAFLHILRFLYGWEAAIGGVVIPQWASGAAAVVAGFFAYRAFGVRKNFQ